MHSFPKTLSSFLWLFVKKNFWSFFFIQFFCLAWTLDSIAWPMIVARIVSEIEVYTGPRNMIWDQIAHIVILGGILWILIEIGFRASGILMAKVIPGFEADIRVSLFNYVTRQSHSYFANNYSGSLSNKINDMPRSAHSIVSLCMTLFAPVILTTFVMTFVFAWLYPLFGVIIFIWVCLHLGICLLVSKKCQNLSNLHAESRSRLAGRIVDSFLNNVIVRIFARRKYEVEFTKFFQSDEKNKHIEAAMYIEKVKILLGAICFIFIGVILTTLQIYTYKMGIINLGDFIFIFQGAVNIITITWTAGLELPRLFQEIGVCQQAMSIVTTPLNIVDKPGAKSIVIDKGEIEFKNVSFRYERNNNIFDDQSIVIKPGEKVGLVGFSGGGKTTFANLILRYYDINGGQILIDSQDISQVTQDSLREQIVMISQEPLMFHRSLMENIRYGNINATDEEVIEASKKAHCDEFIQKLKDKYHTVVGERGLKISGGQRQRIAIARAILKKSLILIMDEATSALDSITESYIQEAIKEMSKDRTTLIIAHRLSTLADMDRILVFKDGHIVEDGTHDELYDLDGHYRELWDMQSDGFLPEGEDDEQEDEE